MSGRDVVGSYAVCSGEGCSCKEQVSVARDTPIFSSEVVRIKDPDTGGEKEQKLERFDLMPPEALKAVSRVYGRGAAKYSPRNWERGYAWSLSYAALQRHLNAFWSGNDIDESGEPHLAHAAFHILALLEYAKTHPEKDDRPKV